MNWLTPLWAAPAALGFALLFNIRAKALPGVCALAVLGMAIRNICTSQGMSLTIASFLAALVIGAVGYTAGPWTHEASPVYAFAPVIPMVPGSSIFKALGAVVTWQLDKPNSTSPETAELLVGMASDALRATSVTLALAIGTILPMLLLPWARRGLGAP